MRIEVVNSFFKGVKSLFSMSRCRAFLVVIIAVGEGSTFVAVGKEPSLGKKAAAQYFIERNKTKEQKVAERGDLSHHASAQANKARFLALYFGTYLDEEIYKWGSKENDGEGEGGLFTAGVTYRIGEWVNLMDLYFQADFNTYKLKEGKPRKMSLMSLVAFPDVNSGFPLYFGAGAGLGVYFKQIDGESSISFDYQLGMGVRLFRFLGEAGLNLEVGLKNHLHLFSDGQYKGMFAALGTFFNF